MLRCHVVRWVVSKQQTKNQLFVFLRLKALMHEFRKQSALKSEKRQSYEHSLKNKKFPDILIIMQPLKNICVIGVIAALQFYCLSCTYYPAIPFCAIFPLL